MTIFIDDRAGSSDLIDYPPLFGISTLTRLDHGDICFSGCGPKGKNLLIGIELKSISDLISSTECGRLQATQIPGMLKTYDESWLLYYTPYKITKRSCIQIYKGRRWWDYKLGKRPVTTSYIERVLLTLTAAGVHVKHVNNMAEAAIWTNELYSWWSKPFDTHRGMHVFDESQSMSIMPKIPNDVLLRARIASQLSGVGYKRALAAGYHFGSVREMINADEAEWASIEGVGKVIARNVNNALE